MQQQGAFRSPGTCNNSSAPGLAEAFLVNVWQRDTAAQAHLLPVVGAQGRAE
jgi:hypothetical protein